MPSGVTAAFSPNPTATTSTLTLTANPTATTRPVTSSCAGSSGALSTAPTLSLTVAAAPTYTLSASPGSLTVTQGSSGSSTITVSPQNGFTGSVTLSPSTLPSGVTAAFSPNPTATTSTLRFTANSAAATGTVTVTITGASGTLTRPASLTVAPPPPPPLTLFSLGLTRLVGARGGSSTGTVTLSAPAPSGGAVVFLSSNNGLARVPSSVTVPAGAISATFTVNTSIVIISTTATISGSYNGTTKSASLAILL